MDDKYSDEALEFIQNQVIDLQGKNKVLFQQNLKHELVISDKNGQINLLNAQQSQLKQTIQSYEEQMKLLGILNFDNKGILDLQKYQNENLQFKQQFLDQQKKYEQLNEDYNTAIDAKKLMNDEIAQLIDNLNQQEISFQDKFFLVQNEISEKEQTNQDLAQELRIAKQLIQSQNQHSAEIQLSKKTLQKELNIIISEFEQYELENKQQISLFEDMINKKQTENLQLQTSQKLLIDSLQEYKQILNTITTDCSNIKLLWDQHIFDKFNNYFSEIQQLLTQFDQKKNNKLASKQQEEIQFINKEIYNIQTTVNIFKQSSSQTYDELQNAIQLQLTQQNYVSLEKQQQFMSILATSLAEIYQIKKQINNLSNQSPLNIDLISESINNILSITKSYQSELTSKSNTIVTLTTENELLTTSQTSSNKQLDTLKLEIIVQQQLLQKQTEQISAFNLQITEQHKLLKQAQIDSNSHVHELASKQSKINELQSEIDLLQQNLIKNEQKFTSQIASVKLVYGTQISDLQEKIVLLEKENQQQNWLSESAKGQLQAAFNYTSYYGQKVANYAFQSTQTEEIVCEDVQEKKQFLDRETLNAMISVENEILVKCGFLSDEFVRDVLQLKKEGNVLLESAEVILEQRALNKTYEESPEFEQILGVQKVYFQGKLSKLIQSCDVNEFISENNFTKTQIKLIKQIFIHVEEYMKRYIVGLDKQIVSLRNELRFQQIYTGRILRSKENSKSGAKDMFIVQDLQQSDQQKYYQSIIDNLRQQILILKLKQ